MTLKMKNKCLKKFVSFDKEDRSNSIGIWDISLFESKFPDKKDVYQSCNDARPWCGNNVHADYKNDDNSLFKIKKLSRLI